ncbi:hypothetical protein [Nocardioides insulae]|uniref:hypothetical protein n=1 Tax=Nocardioides insulae TaxID=394734 RepID=UPI00040E373A|nr:hypothetical protein [Nocardioides insulae]
MGGPEQSMYVETQQLYNAAYAWETTAAGGLATASDTVSGCVGGGAYFGLLLDFLGDMQDEFAREVATQLEAGRKAVAGIGESLGTVAADYEATDANQATLYPISDLED